MSRRLLLLVLAAPVVLLIIAAMSRPESAVAHPLGNFTVNQYSRLELYSDAVRIKYVLDMAEIPAFQEIGQIDTNGDGETGASENDAYLARRASDLSNNLHLSLNGSPAALELLSSEIAFPEGQAGLRTLRISLLLHSSAPVGHMSIEYRDENYADRIGWREVLVRPAQGVTVSHSNVASQDISSELTSYPDNLLSSPLDVTAATVSYESSNGVLAPLVGDIGTTDTQLAGSAGSAGMGFASLIDRDEMTLSVIVLSVFLALGFGAIHALEPGHGKTFVAAYFVGVRGTVRQAVGLGAIVAVTHTIGVLAIGMIVLFGSQYILPERLYPWLSLASGVMVLALGLRLIATRAGGLRAVRRFTGIVVPGHRDRHHGHHHSHRHVPEAEGGAPPWKALLALGLADGLTPSPSALVVLLAAVSLDRIGLGLMLIVAFSVGLATVLTAVSLGLLYARRILEWLGRRAQLPGGGFATRSVGSTLGSATSLLLRAAPLTGAVALLAIGLLLTIRALTQPGFPVL